MIKKLWNEVIVTPFYESWCTKKGLGRLFLATPVIFLYAHNDYNIWLTLGMAFLMAWGMHWVIGDMNES